MNSTYKIPLVRAYQNHLSAKKRFPSSELIKIICLQAIHVHTICSPRRSSSKSAFLSALIRLPSSEIIKMLKFICKENVVYCCNYRLLSHLFFVQNTTERWRWFSLHFLELSWRILPQTQTCCWPVMRFCQRGEKNTGVENLIVVVLPDQQRFVFFSLFARCARLNLVWN